MNIFFSKIKFMDIKYLQKLSAYKIKKKTIKTSLNKQNKKL